MSSPNQNLFLVKNETSSNILLLLNRFLELNINITYIDSLNQDQKAKLLSFSTTKTLPVYQEGDFVLSGSQSIINYLLSLNPKISTLLIGSTAQNIARIGSWVEFSSYRIQELDLVLLRENVDKDSSALALADLDITLDTLNSHLKLRTFLTGYSYTLSDLAVSIALRPYFERIISKETRAKFNHVSRWFNFCSSLSEVVQTFGYIKLI